MRTRLEKAIDYIGGYCRKHYTCDLCPLHTEDGCKLNDRDVVDWGSDYLHEEAKEEKR